LAACTRAPEVRARRLLAFPRDRDAALAAAVYLHGLAGQLGAAELGEKSLISTDLLRFFPAAMHACL
jgi:NAD(P)H-hydrate epimerase